MSFDMRRRQEGTRKRGYLDSTLETSSLANSNSNTITDNSNNNSSSYVYVSPKAYAVHDPSLEDLDRLIMFITESKQIQGRYYVRYLPGMMNSSGELTPCNYRPTFSFSPPRSPVSSSTTTTTTTTTSSSNNCYNRSSRNTSLANNNNNRSTFPDVVDLTKEDDLAAAASQSASTKDFFSGTQPYSDGRRLDRRRSYSSSDSERNERKRKNETSCSDDDDDDDDDEKSGLGPSSGSTSTNPVFTNRKQTARKSMRPRSEIRPNKMPDMKCAYSKSDDEEIDQENSYSITNSGGQETSLSPDGTLISESKTKSSNNDNNNSNNIYNNNSASSSSKANTVNNINSPSHNTSRGLSEKWSLLDGITITVNPDFG